MDSVSVYNCFHVQNMHLMQAREAVNRVLCQECIQGRQDVYLPPMQPGKDQGALCRTPGAVAKLATAQGVRYLTGGVQGHSGISGWHLCHLCNSSAQGVCSTRGPLSPQW